jgi:hypothetical protein
LPPKIRTVGVNSNFPLQLLACPENFVPAEELVKAGTGGLEDGEAEVHSGEIITVLRQVEVALGSGKTAPQACREAGITEQTYNRWRKEFGGLKLEQAKRLRELEKENSRLKRLVAELLEPYAHGGRGSICEGRSEGLRRRPGLMAQAAALVPAITTSVRSTAARERCSSSGRLGRQPN